MKIFLIRHGKTEYNERRAYCGALDPSLTDLGRQELETAEARQALAMDPPDLVFCSPMKRAQETAEVLLPHDRPVSLLLSQELREIDFGDFEGQSYEDLKDDPGYCAWLDTHCEGPIPGGDFPDSFRDDVEVGFETLLETCRLERAGTVAVITHGGVIGTILERFAKPQKHWYEWHIPCGGYVVVEGERELEVTTLGGGATC